MTTKGQEGVVPQNDRVGLHASAEQDGAPGGVDVGSRIRRRVVGPQVGRSVVRRPDGGGEKVRHPLPLLTEQHARDHPSRRLFVEVEDRVSRAAALVVDVLVDGEHVARIGVRRGRIAGPSRLRVAGTPGRLVSEPVVLGPDVVAVRRLRDLQELEDLVEHEIRRVLPVLDPELRKENVYRVELRSGGLSHGFFSLLRS